MCRGFVCTLLSLLLTGVGVCKQPAPEQGLGSSSQGTPQVQTPATDPRAGELDELKATVHQLQDRLNQLAPESSESEVKSVWPMNAYWKDGLQIESQNSVFRVHVGGTLQIDSGWNAASQAVESGPGGIGELQDGGILRRARIRID